MGELLKGVEKKEYTIPVAMCSEIGPLNIVIGLLNK